MSRPTLSVVMPNYNHARYLAEAIRGIACQSRPPDEFLILDDGSSDDSLEIIEAFRPRYPFLRVIRHEQNRGVNASAGRLFAEAKGDYVFSGAADDIRLPGFFERAMELAERFPEAGLLFGMFGAFDEAGRRLITGTARRWQQSLYAGPDRFLREYLLAERPSHSASAATIFRRDALREVGGYRAELGSWADTFAIHAIGLKYGACYLAQEVVQVRLLSGSYSQQSGRRPQATLDMIARAERLMKSDEFRDRFPADYVRRWRQAYRRQVILGYILGPEGPGAARPSFLVRNVRRLPRLIPALFLLAYRGDRGGDADRNRCRPHTPCARQPDGGECGGGADRDPA